MMRAYEQGSLEKGQTSLQSVTSGSFDGPGDSSKDMRKEPFVVPDRFGMPQRRVKAATRSPACVRR